MTCKACGGEHRGWERCTKKPVVHAPLVVHHEPVKVVHTKHGKYANLEQRKAYRREWMRNKRATAK